MKFKVVEKANPINREAPKKFYAQIVTEGETTMDDLVQEIEKFSALSEPDIRGVIIAFENAIQKKLAEGRIVRMEKMGSFYPSLSSVGEESAEKVTAHSIRAVRVNYRPGKRILDALKNCTKSKISGK